MSAAQPDPQPNDQLPGPSHWFGRRPTLTALLAYAALAMLFYLPLLLGLRAFPDGDFTHHFLPFSLFQHDALRTLTLPVWNPYTYSGHPFLADIQAAAYYPLSNGLLLLTLPFESPGARLYWLQVEAIGQSALGGFFLYLFLRELTNTPWAAFTGGAIFMLSGYLTAYPPLQLAVLRTAVWLPLTLWLLWRAFAARSSHRAAWRWWIGAGVVYAVAFSAGHPQTFLHLSYTVAAWIVFLWISAARREVIARPQPLLGLLLFGLTAGGLSAAQLLPSVEFTRLSVRAAVDYAYVAGGLPLRDTWQLLLPGVFTQYSTLYVGVVGLGLAFFGLGALTSRNYAAATEDAARPASNRALIAFFAILALIALLLAYGGNSFLYPLVYRLAPGWDLFRGQERAAYLVALALSVLAAYGATASPIMGIHLRKRLGLLYGALITILVYTFGLFWQFNGQTVMGPWRYLLLALMTLLLGVGTSLVVWLPGWSRRRSLLLLALAVGNLFIINFGVNFSPNGPARTVLLAPEMMALGAAVEERGAANLGLPGRAYNEFRIYEDYGMRQEIEDVWGSSPLRLARYAMLFDEFPLDRMWDLTGVEHVLTWRQELFEPSAQLAEFPQSADTTYLHRLTDSNPRAWLVNAVQVADDAAARDLLADHQFDLTKIALLPPALLGDATPPALAPADDSTITLARPAHNRLHVALDRPDEGASNAASERDALLVISENWLPGWRIENAACLPEPCPAAELGVLPRLQPQRVNLTLLGVILPPGDVSFDLVYAPASVRNGLWITLATLLALAAFGLVTGLHARRQR